MGLGVIRSLGSLGVPIVSVSYDEKDIGDVSKYVSEKIEAPHPEKYEDQFVATLIDISSSYNRGILIPASDAALAVVARHKKTLENHYIVACTEWEITEQFIKKELTYKLANTIGVLFPKTLIPECIEEVENFNNTIELPCLIKPSQSHLFTAYFGEKMFQVENLDQMISAYKKATDANLEIMLQEIIPGSEQNGANYNSYFWDGQPLVEFTAEKIRNGPPFFGSPRVARSKEIPEVIESGRKILQALGFYGYSCIEFKKDDRDGKYKLLEVNGRHNLSSLLAPRCGINFPWLHYNHLVNDIKPTECDFQSGIYWIDIARDVGYSLEYLGKEKISVLQFIRPYIGPRVFAILDFKDIKPFLKKIYLTIKLAFSKIFSG